MTPKRVPAEEKLTKFAEQQRKENLAKNTYIEGSGYGPGHSNAISDGDEKGRGQQDGQVGTSVDIMERKKMLNKNFYNKDNPYNEG